MRRLKREGGSVFILGLAAAFGAAGLYLGWGALARGEDALGTAAALVGMAVVLLALGGREILTDLELWRAKIVVPARVTAVQTDHSMNVNYTMYRWQLKAEGRLPGGQTTEFVSPYIFAKSPPPVAIGSIVEVSVSPRSGRYRMNLDSLAL